jgi:ATP-binding cassette subfamily B protein
LLGIVFVVLSNYFGVLIPQKIREALDFVQSEIQNYKLLVDSAKTAEYDLLSNTLFWFGITVIGYMVLKGILMYLMRQTIIVMSRLVEYDLRKDLFAHLESLDTAFYKRNKTGDLMARISEDVSKVRMYLGPAILYGINITSLFVLTIYTMIKVNPELSFYTLIPLPFLSLSIFFVSKMINNRSTIIQTQMSVLTSISQEIYSGIRVVKSYVKEDQFSKYFEEESEDYKAKSLDLARINAYFFPFMIFFISMSTLIVLYVGGIKVSQGEISPGNIAEFIIYVNMLTWPVTSIGWIASLIQQAAASQKRLNDLLDQKSEIKEKTEISSFGNGDIHFKNVSFVYPDTGIKALNNLNFTIRKGERVAIIGKTAAGKSTIPELLMRLYDPTSGDILINETNINDYSIHELRNLISFVPQDLFLFSDTISNNIQFGTNHNISETILENYADYAAIKDEILSLPKGFETRVGERGVTLSGGQKQRISIARALIKDSEILILDDSLSAVDPTTEQKILNHLNDSIEEKTLIIITHRINTLSNIDKVIVLDEGEIVEIGTPEELLKNEGYYFKMMNN